MPKRKKSKSNNQKKSDSVKKSQTVSLKEEYEQKFEPLRKTYLEISQNIIEKQNDLRELNNSREEILGHIRELQVKYSSIINDENDESNVSSEDEMSSNSDSSKSESEADSDSDNENDITNDMQSDNNKI